MKNDLVAQSETTIAAGKQKVWDALVNPEMIRQYMFGTTVESGWETGSSITWKGEWKGKPYEDHGKILEILPGKKLQYTHFSPLTGKEDRPENYHTVTIQLEDAASNHTKVILTQDGNETPDAKEHSQKNWEAMLEALKKLMEKV